MGVEIKHLNDGRIIVSKTITIEDVLDDVDVLVEELREDFTKEGLDNFIVELKKLR